MRVFAIIAVVVAAIGYHMYATGNAFSEGYKAATIQSACFWKSQMWTKADDGETQWMRRALADACDRK